MMSHNALLKLFYKGHCALKEKTWPLVFIVTTNVQFVSWATESTPDHNVHSGKSNNL